VPTFRRLAAGTLAAAFAVSLLPAAPAQADPPPWAPAHGWRAKHEGKHKRKHDDDDRVVYVMPYGVGERTCYRDLLGAAIGGAAGGLAGSKIGKGDGRTAAIVGGAVIGILVGGAIGRAMDQVDQACVGQVLVYAPDRYPVRWSDYEIAPTRTWQQDGRYCREYQSRASIGGRPELIYGTACRMPDGSWRIVG
jgi:surface antigen